jgi:hypothetical protein
VEISSAGSEGADVRLTRGEVLAIRNIAERADMVPFELRGPGQMFERLASQFGELAESMTSPSWTTGRATSADSGATTRDEFGEFVLGVLADFAGSGRAEWENNTLERFLDGLAAFALARVNGRAVEEQEMASWALFAELIAAATGYE